MLSEGPTRIQRPVITRNGLRYSWSENAKRADIQLNGENIEYTPSSYALLKMEPVTTTYENAIIDKAHGDWTAHGDVGIYRLVRS